MLFFFFLLVGKRRSAHLQGVVLEINIFPSSGTLKPRLKCPAPETPVLEPELLLVLACCIPVRITSVSSVNC